MIAEFGIKRELENKLSVTEYENGNGDFHFHSQIELCVVTEGEIEALVNNKCQRLKCGELAIALSYETHMYIPVGNAKFTVLIIPADLCREFTETVKPKSNSIPFIKSSAITREIALYIDEIKNDQNCFITKTGYVYLILGMILKNLSFDAKSTPSDTDLAHKILMYIHNNFASDITLASVASHLGYNSSYISQFFKANFNIGIKRYINIIRLNSAISLIKEAHHSITYCAMESGFNSLRTFYRVFYSEFNCTPQEYIKLQQSATDKTLS